MGMQIVVRNADPQLIRAALGIVAEEMELFPMAGNMFGLSIPGRVVSAVGEQIILGWMATLEYFDLHEGVWQQPKG